MKNLKNMHRFIKENEDESEREYGPFVAIYSEKDEELIAIFPAWRKEWIQRTYDSAVESEKERWAEEYCDNWYENNPRAYRPGNYYNPPEWDDCEPDMSQFEQSIDMTRPFMKIPVEIEKYVTPEIMEEFESTGIYEA